MILPDISFQQRKDLTVILNGQSTSSFEFSYFPPLSVNILTKNIESKWGNKIKRLRIYNQDGVEFYTEDIRYLKDKEKIYVSLRGEDFDANSSYGEYEVIRQLGEGGFGKVFFARHKQSKQPVAIKLMKSGSFLGVGQVDTVFSQAQNLQALNHPNIVKIINCYALKQMQVVVIMEYMAGGELLSLLNEKERFTQNEARQFFKQMVNAVSYCHSKNIIHRDLKLENILLKEKGSSEIKIADFGISSVKKQFNPHANVGTLKYMPPQILMGSEKGTTISVDVWSLGIILYLMVTGKLPFNGNNYSDILKMITNSQPLFPSQLNLSIQLQALINRLLQKDPKKRIKTQQIKEHIWLKIVQQKGILSLTSVNASKIPPHHNHKKRESIDQISLRKKNEKLLPLQKQKGFIRSSVSIPKKLQKQKGSLMRQLMKYGKGKHMNSKNQQSSKLANRKILQICDPRFRKCLIQ